MLYLSNYTVETIHVNEGFKYFPRGPHVGQPWLIPWVIFATFRKFASSSFSGKNLGISDFAEFKSLKTVIMKFLADLFSYEDNNAHGRKDTPATNTVCSCFVSLGSE